MDLGAMHQLFQHMGYSQVAVTAVVDKQGINSLDELSAFSRTRRSQTCASVRSFIVPVVRLLILTHYSKEISPT
jgi:hypothetical protein